MKNKLKKLLSVLLCAAMTASATPYAFAEEDDKIRAEVIVENDETDETEEESETDEEAIGKDEYLRFKKTDAVENYGLVDGIIEEVFNKIENEINDLRVRIEGWMPEDAEILLEKIDVDETMFAEAGLELLTAVDIKIGGRSGEWQPDGDTVEVTLDNIWEYDENGNKPAIDVIHFLDTVEAIESARENGTLLTGNADEADGDFEREIEAAYEAGLDYGTIAFTVITSSNGDVELNDDGSITFETDSFSIFWVTTGATVSLGALFDGAEHEINMVPGSKVTLRAWINFLLQIDRSNVNSKVEAVGQQALLYRDITITAPTDATTDDNITFTISWFIPFLGTQTVEIKVNIITPDEYLEHEWAQKSKYPVYLAVRTDGVMQNEPTKQGENNYYYLNGNYLVQDTYFASAAGSYDDTGAKGIIIQPSILTNENFVEATDGTATQGIFDATGEDVNAVLVPGAINTDKILTALVNIEDGFYIQQGENTVKLTADNKENYNVIPYVVKFTAVVDENGAITDESCWYINCVVVPKDFVTLSYNLNIQSGFSTKATAPVSKSVVKGTETSVDAITGLDDNGDVEVWNTADDRESYTFHFQGWSTTPDGDVKYAPEDKITISENTTLYAVWTSNYGTGKIQITKVIDSDSGLTNEQKEKSFTFTVKFTEDSDTLTGSYGYRIYNSDGNAVNGDGASGLIYNNGTFNLYHDQYIIISDLPTGTTVTVTETTETGYKTSWDGQNEATDGKTTATISGGRTVAVTCTNIYESKGSLTITKKYPTGADYSIDENQSFVFTVKGTDANTSAVDMQVVIHGNGSVTIKDLPIGTYTVTEDENWSWRYTPDGNNKSVTLTSAGVELTFTNTREDKSTSTGSGWKWLNGCAYATNKFTANTAN